MKVVLGKFGRSCIEDHLGADLTVGVQAALLHYTRRLRSGWEPVRPPQFSCNQPLADTGSPFEVAVSAKTEAALEREARRHHVSIGRVLLHAVFVYVADLDSTFRSESDARRVVPLAPEG